MFSDVLSTNIEENNEAQPCEKNGRTKVMQEIREWPGRHKTVQAGGGLYNDSEIGDPGYRSAKIDVSRA